MVNLKGDGQRAKVLFQQGLDIAREVADEAEAAAALNSLGVVLWNDGDVDGARVALAESLAIDRRLGQRARLPVRLNNLALLAIDAGDLELGRVYLAECLAIDEELGNKVGVADSLENLGWITYLEGRLAEAARQYVESLEIRRDLGDRYGVAYSLESIGAATAADGAYEQAARLYGAAEALRAAIGAPLPQSEMARYQRGLETIRAKLDESAMTAAWEEGRTWSWMHAAGPGPRSCSRDRRPRPTLRAEVNVASACRRSTPDVETSPVDAEDITTNLVAAPGYGTISTGVPMGAQS